MKRSVLAFTLINVLLFSLVFVGCEDVDNGKDVPTELAYAGSETCKECHSAIYDKFINSGHPYKLNKVINGQQPVIPFTTAAGLTIPTPAGYDWTNITYMIGGFGWKARFIDENGFIITKNADTQYNLEDGSQVAYHSDDEIGTIKYDCGRCHTTGWKSVADGGIPQDGLAGMDGEFFAGGVHCEECHGQGNIHAVTKEESDISIDNTSAYCGSCHYRNEDHTIASSGGFIKHHEQYDEMLTSAHDASISCNTCHDPHGSVKHGQTTGLIARCTDCHGAGGSATQITNNTSHNGADCVICHMPKSSKSAIMKNVYEGDIRTHIFKIATELDAADNYFTSDGAITNANGNGVPLTFVCYQCHTDEAGVGGSNSEKTIQALVTKATNFHGTK